MFWRKKPMEIIDEVINVAEELTVGKSEPKLCDKCAPLLTTNGIEWQLLCDDCRKKFVQEDKATS
jgi:hypothetical protein